MMHEGGGLGGGASAELSLGTSRSLPGSSSRW